MARQVSGIKWITPPKALADAIEGYDKKALASAHAIGVYVGTKMQNESRRNARWEDRTGNARGGLFFAVDGVGLGGEEGKVTPGNAREFHKNRDGSRGAGGNEQLLVIVLGHTMEYGVSLELDHGGRYAIIVPTLNANVQVLKQMLAEAFG